MNWFSELKMLFCSLIRFFLLSSGNVLALVDRLVTKGDSVQLSCSCHDPVWFGPPNGSIYAVADDIVENLKGNVSVKNENGKSNLSILNFSDRNQGNYSCASVDCVHFYSLTIKFGSCISEKRLSPLNTLRNPYSQCEPGLPNVYFLLLLTYDLFVLDASSVVITYRNYLTGRWLTCSLGQLSDNYTFLAWQHLSIFHEHIRYLDGNRRGILKLDDTLGETDRHNDVGLYLCRVTKGLPFGDNLVISKEYLLNSSGKPYFVSSNNDIQSSVIEQQIHVLFYVISIPNFKRITITNKNMLPIEANFSQDDNVKTYDIVYGKRITVLAAKISMLIYSTDLDDNQWYNVIVTNRYGSGSYKITMKQTKTNSLFPKQTHLLILVIIVVLVLLLTSAATYIGKKATNCNIIQFQRGEANLQTELGEDIRQYDEIDIPNIGDSITTVQVIEHIEPDMQIPTTSLNFTEVNRGNAYDSTTCLSELDEIFKTRPSSISTNSSDCSYLNPSRPYTKLNTIRDRLHSFHNYEIITNIDVEIDLIKRPDLLHNKPCIKRSTI